MATVDLENFKPQLSKKWKDYAKLALVPIKWSYRATKWVWPRLKRLFSSRLAKGLFIFSASFHVLFWVIHLVRGGEPLFIVAYNQVFIDWAGAPEILDYFAEDILRTLSIIGMLTFHFAVAYMIYLVVTGKIKRAFSWLGLWWGSRGPIITNVHEAARRMYSNQNTGTFMTMVADYPTASKKTKKLTFTDDRHVTMIASSRAGKGRSIIVPNLLHHKGSAVVYDPAGENFELTAAYRQQVLGQRIVLLDPFGVTGHPSDRWNPLEDIDFDNDPFALDKCYLIAESLQRSVGKDPYWSQASQKMLAMITAYVGARSIPENLHLPSVRDLIMTGSPEALWAALSKESSFNGIIGRFGTSNATREERELNSVMEMSRNALRWLDSPVMSEFMTGSTFSMSDLKKEDVTIYIVLPAGWGDVYSSWTRMLFNAAFDAMQDLSIPKPEQPVLFMMDEFPLLGPMDRFLKASGEAAKFGVRLFICAQNVAQLQSIYGEAWETFIANSGLLIMFSNNDLGSQSYLSARLGKHWVKQISSTSGSGGGSSSSSTNTSYALEDVARGTEIERMASRQAGKAFFFIPGAKPMCLPRANHDQWAMIPQNLTYTPRAAETDAIAVAAE